MALHKAPDGSIHDDMDGTALHLLPAGSAQITDEEASDLRPKPDASAIIESKKWAVRQVREGILNRLAGIALAAQLLGDTLTTSAYVTVRQGLLDITKNWPTDPALVDALVMQQYDAIRAQCTPAMIGAFAQVDA